jgi:16S rRNA (cytidine1402-2'-O)-methyltransferase
VRPTNDTAGNTTGTLFVVATPIGNLDDISLRARNVLADAACIAAEDTRRTGRLLEKLGISARLVSCHDHNEAERAPQLVAELLAGHDVALVSDAGTPLLSDPGFRLVNAAIAAGAVVTPVPGCWPADRSPVVRRLPARHGGASAQAPR